MKNLNLALLLIFLPACSLYESQGRKDLEQNAFQYAGGSASAQMTSCQRESIDPSKWALLDRNSQAELFTFENDKSFELKVHPVNDSSYACNFKFSSAQELFEKSQAAVDLTIYELSQGEVTPPKTR